ncbi:MAG: SLC13 family permease [Spirochaetota bacterium]
MPPVIASLGAAYGILLFIYREKFSLAADDMGKGSFQEKRHIPLNKRQSFKGLIVLTAVIFCFFTPAHREAVVIIAAGFLLCSRTIKTVELLGFVDWQLITLFCGLFIVIKGISVTGIPAEWVADMAAKGFSLQNGYILTGISALLSNIVSNVPATMLLVPHLSDGNPPQWYILALASTFAGNLITIGSIANLITFQIADSFGVKVSFREHARAGIPVTVASLLILCLWISVRL